jgi:hypothetical protein
LTVYGLAHLAWRLKLSIELAAVIDALTKVIWRRLAVMLRCWWRLPNVAYRLPPDCVTLQSLQRFAAVHTQEELAAACILQHEMQSLLACLLCFLTARISLLYCLYVRRSRRSWLPLAMMPRCWLKQPRCLWRASAAHSTGCHLWIGCRARGGGGGSATSGYLHCKAVLSNFITVVYDVCSASCRGGIISACPAWTRCH